MKFFYSPVPFFIHRYHILFTGTALIFIHRYHFLFTGTIFFYSPVPPYFLFTSSALICIHRYHILFTGTINFSYRYHCFNASGSDFILFTGSVLTVSSVLFTGLVLSRSGLINFTGLIVFYTKVPAQSVNTGPIY